MKHLLKGAVILWYKITAQESTEDCVSKNSKMAKYTKKNHLKDRKKKGNEFKEKNHLFKKDTQL